jgi:hypothetical protein
VARSWRATKRAHIMRLWPRTREPDDALHSRLVSELGLEKGEVRLALLAERGPLVSTLSICGFSAVVPIFGMVNPAIAILSSRSEIVSLPSSQVPMMEEVMAHALRAFRTGGLTDAVLRFVDATLRWGFDARTRGQDGNRDR